MSNLVIEVDNSGHRKRQKDQLVRSTLGSLDDYIILELLLFNSIPRVDVKPIAKALLKEFGSLDKVINAKEDKISKFPKIGESTIALFKLAQELVYRISKEKILDKPIIGSWDKLIDYLRTSIGHSSTENLCILYLNNKNILIKDKIYNYGTVNSVSIYPREIVTEALHYNACSIVIVHNHPSGITGPSKSDLLLTEAVKKALDAVSITLIDHIIISSNSYFSFKKHKLI